MIVTKTGKPLTYEGAVVYFPDVVRAQWFSIRGDQIVKVPTKARSPKPER
jgi:hypothetical protein